MYNQGRLRDSLKSVFLKAGPHSGRLLALTTYIRLGWFEVTDTLAHSTELKLTAVKTFTVQAHGLLNKQSLYSTKQRNGHLPEWESIREIFLR